MTITYSGYPLLLYSSFDKNNAPKELVLGAESEVALEYLNNSKGVQELFGYIAAIKTLDKKKEHKIYLLSKALFTRIDSNDHFRNSEFSYFFTNYVQPGTGTQV